MLPTLEDIEDDVEHRTSVNTVNSLQGIIQQQYNAEQAGLGLVVDLEL